jgi:hypothetical protein
MRNVFMFVLMFAVTVAALPSRLFASAGAAREQAVPQAGSLSGVARGGDQGILSSQRVQLRNLDSGQVVSSTTSGPTGSFSFPGLTPGNYMVELVDAAGKVVGISTPVSVTAGVAATATVTASAAGALTAAAAGGAGILGLGTVTSVAVIGAAAITGTAVAFKAVGPNASPSR